VYDVTRRETFEDLERIWMKEVDIYSNIEEAVKMVVANKVDLVSLGPYCTLQLWTCMCAQQCPQAAPGMSGDQQGRATIF
jgi:hypothetical protein